jgi:Rap1a immunity proteins
MSRSRLNLCGFVFVAALMSSGGSVFAEQDSKSANYVMPGCRSIVEDKNTEIYMRGYCLGLISGIYSMSQRICAPAEVTNSQLARVVVQYIDARPARMHENFGKFALEAMQAAWPCRR